MRETGVGLVVRRDEIGSLARRLTEVDYPALVGQVEKAQARFRFDNFFPAILDLLRGPGAAVGAANPPDVEASSRGPALRARLPA